MADPAAGVFLDEASAGPFYGLPPVDPWLRGGATSPEKLVTSASEDADSVQVLTLQELSRRALENATVPIDTLPTEMLLEVFRYFVAPLSILEPKVDQPPSWLPLMGVCRSWCALIRGTPAFWASAIVVGFNLHWLELSLRRSRDLPVSLRITLSEDGFETEPYIRTLRPHGTRIRRLFLSTLLMSRNKKNVEDLIETPLPTLTTLHLDFDHRKPFSYVWDPAKIVLNRDRYPSLTHLHLNVGLILAWTPSLFMNLRHLSLLYCPLSTHRLSLTQFLDALERGGQHMESLTLGDFLTGTGLVDSPDEPGRVVTLPKLRVLRLIAEKPACISLLISHIRLPQFGEIELRGTITSEEELNHPQLDRLLPRDLRNAPFLHKATALEVDVEGSKFVISGRVHETLTFKLHQCDECRGYNIMETRGPLLGDALEQLIALFADSPLRSLKVSGTLHRTFPPTWDTLFARFPGLKTLDLSLYSPNHEAAFPLFISDALASSSYAQGSPRPGDIRSRDVSVVPCPALETLAIHGTSWNPGDSRRFGQILRRREQAGAPRLATFTLAPFVPRVEEAGVLESLDESIRPFVEDLQFLRETDAGRHW
ncbi:hypothetical protein BD413DRAFT_313796 [Trametes elegans]|nr:hypothetical protein BD413DRAFT_313796 [Trametes elegans]